MLIIVVIPVIIVVVLLIVLEFIRTTKFGKLDYTIAGILAYSNYVEKDVDEIPLNEHRELMVKDIKMISGKIPFVPVVEDLHVSSCTEDIPIRIYRPENPENQPVVLYFHGGGFVKGCNDTAVNICSYLQNITGVVIISVDYRLAPEFPYPAAIDDGLTVLNWVCENYLKIGIDPLNIIVAGDSAGGTISAVLSQIAGEKISYQILLYPVTDMKSFNSESYKNFGEGFLLTRSLMEWFRNHYLPDRERWMDPKASPIFEDNLSNVPPALIITADFDILRDEGREYADKLAAAGVDTEYINVTGVIHGFLSMTGIVPKARKILSLVGQRINKQTRAVEKI